MSLPDVAELRRLLKYMMPAERDEVRRYIFAGELELDRLSFHELLRLEHLGRKLTAAWPYCQGNFFGLTLLELLTALDGLTRPR